MRVLVTGGAGFIGSQYVRTLLTGGYPAYADAGVTVLDALTYAGTLTSLEKVLDDPHLTFVHGDVADADLVADLVPGHDAVVHFAAETSVDRSIEAAEAFVRTNVLGTQALLDACRRAGGPPLVHVSTDEVYGSIDVGAWSEAHPLEPNSPYAASKAAADLLVRAAARTHALDVRITRCANNYGPYQWPEKVIPRFVAALLDGGRVPLYGDGRHVREWLHVADHCRAVQLVLEKGAPAEIYNVAGTVSLSNRELTARLLALCGADWNRVDSVPDRPGHDQRYSLDDSKIRTELGYAPRVPFDTGLAETVRWYAEHRSWWEPLLA